MTASAKDSELKVLVHQSSFLLSFPFQNLHQFWQGSPIRSRERSAARARWGGARDSVGPHQPWAIPAALLPLLAAGDAEGGLEGHGSCHGQHGTELYLVLLKPCMWVCPACVEMLVRSVAEVLQWVSVMLQLLLFCLAASGQLLYFSVLVFFPLTDVCSLACVAGEPQCCGDVSEVPSVTRAAGSGAGASHSTSLAPQRRRSQHSPSTGSVY